MSNLIHWFFRANILLIFIYFIILPVSAVNITSCQVLNITGVYNLTNDITDLSSETCMEITATGVTLNCQGHIITGNRTTGIYSNKHNTIIKNCILSNWEKGIVYEGSNNGFIENTTIHSTNTGIYFSLSSNNTILNSMLKGNNYGLELGFSSAENKIYNNLFNNTNNVKFSSGYFPNSWNTIKQKGGRICSDGIYIGGNYWTNPEGAGYSDTCTDSNTDGFCDEFYNLSQNNIDNLPLSDEYILDIIPPEIKINSPLDNQIIDSFEIEVSISVSDSTLDYTNISIKQNGVVEDSVITTESGTFVVKLNVTKGGYYNITVTAYDFAENSNTTTVINILTPLGVSKCSNLNIEGGNYLLEKDITNLEGAICINMQADNINLDCRNYTIYYSGGSYTSGIYLNNRKNIVIKNCNIRDWSYGILLESSSENTIFNSIISNNNNGIFLSSSSENKIYNNLFNNTNNVQFGGDYLVNFWNIEKQEGNRIYSNGTYIGGNYWSNPGGGYSENCEDLNTDGFCDEPYDLGRTSFLFGTGNFIYKLFTGFYFLNPPTGKNTDYLPLSNKFTPDWTPPNTTIKGVKDDGTNYTFGEGTNSSYINITLTCSDLRSGCDKILYCKDTNNTCEPNMEYLTPVRISTEGINYIRFRSIDTEGNNETTKTRTIRLVSTTQKILINYPISNTYLNDYILTINIAILDNKNLNYINISIYNLTGGLVDSILSLENETFSVNLYVSENGVYNITASFYDLYEYIIDTRVSNNVVIDTISPNITSFEIGEIYKEGQEVSGVCFATDNLKGNFEGIITGLDTITTGEKIATCTATDDAGNYDTKPKSYTVIESICEENKKRCLGKELQECRDNKWVTSDTCDYICDPSLLRCITKPIICEEEERRCYGDELQECKNNTWETLKPCKYGCNETRCTPNPNPIKLPPMILIYIVILVLVIGSILVFVYIKLFEKPNKNLNKEILKLELKIKKLKIQGKNVSSIEKELNLAKQDIRMGLHEMAKTRVKSGEKKLKKVK